MPLAAGIVIAIGGVSWQITKDFTLSGIAFGTIVAVAGWHLARVLAPAELRDAETASRRGGGARVGGAASSSTRPARTSSPNPYDTDRR